MASKRYISFSRSCCGSGSRDDDLASQGRDDDEQIGRNPYAIGLWGDLPIRPAGAVGVPNLIADMNAQQLAFTRPRRRPQAGLRQPLRRRAVRAVAGYFNALEAPAMFTPGDNDWTDCDRPSNGGYQSLERLDHERQIFFATPFSLGQRQLRAGGADRRRCASASAGVGALRREPPLDRARRHLRDAEHPGLLQQPVRHRARSGRVSPRATPATSRGCSETFAAAPRAGRRP